MTDRKSEHRALSGQGWGERSMMGKLQGKVATRAAGADVAEHSLPSAALLLPFTATVLSRCGPVVPIPVSQLRTLKPRSLRAFPETGICKMQRDQGPHIGPSP